jgi:superfamily II DNA/RNA helicase
VDDVALVVHADPPIEHKAYLHRSGRTARAGASGTVITLMTDAQRKEVGELTRKAGINATTTRLAPGDPLLERLAPGQRTFAGPLADSDVPADNKQRGQRQTQQQSRSQGRSRSQVQGQGRRQTQQQDESQGQRQSRSRGQRPAGATAQAAKPAGTESTPSRTPARPNRQTAGKTSERQRRTNASPGHRQSPDRAARRSK